MFNKPFSENVSLLSRADSTVSKKSVSFTREPEVVLFEPAHKCAECGVEFVTVHELDDHFERYHQREWVKCLICVKTVKHKEHFVI